MHDTFAQNRIQPYTYQEKHAAKRGINPKFKVWTGNYNFPIAFLKPLLCQDNNCHSNTYLLFGIVGPYLLFFSIDLLKRMFSD